MQPAATDPFAGSWKLDLAKSRFGGPRRPPKELTITMEQKGDQCFDMVTGVAADGSPISDRYTFSNTGGEVRVLEGGGGFPAGTSAALAKRRADSRRKDWTITLPSGGIVTEHDVVSEDGRRLQMTITGTDAQGNPWKTVEVFNRI